MSTYQRSTEFLTKLEIVKLKNIKKLAIGFDEAKRLTAIFGENGCGKSTVLHALACVYQKKDVSNEKHKKGEVYRFSDFFPPTTYAVWSGSELKITYFSNDKVQERSYKKTKDRWTRYDARPRREIYFLGIDLCVPAIEKENKKSKIEIIADDSTALKSKILKDIGDVMGRSYSSIAKSKDGKYKIAEVNGISYPSLFMGAGEHKIIEILNVAHNAGDGSLILIDELDLTLHTFALKELLKKLIYLAEERNLQIIFTTHREDIVRYNLKDKIDIKYMTNSLSDNTDCLDNITSEALIQLTGEIPTERIIYVEDIVSKEIVTRFLQKNNIVEGTEIKIYGSIDNAFTIACGLFLAQDNGLEKAFFVLDGDRHISEKEKLAQIKKKLSGTEEDSDTKRKRVLQHILQYTSIKRNGNEKVDSPEEFIYSSIVENYGDDNWVKKSITRRQSGDNHRKIPNDDLTRRSAIEHFSNLSEIWEKYTNELTEKIINSNQ
ncbi:ATP/GTP-binding protein [Lonepinella sp. MS14435]|uniref:AAA family ATPase n=1 Tax=Lonepinella sp. MS14435 TaxID=3003618 RepID=UPI0036DD65A3